MITFYKFRDADGQEHGPISESALRGLHQSGRISHDTPVFDLGTGQWRAYGDLAPIPELNPEPAPIPVAAPQSLPPAPPRTPTAPSPWAPPPASIRYSESSSDGKRLDHWDWIIFLGTAVVLLVANFMSPSKSAAVPGNSAYEAGQTCGTFIGAFLFPALFLLLRRWWGRLVSVLGCFGFWMILGILAAIALPALLGQRQRAREKANVPMTLTVHSPAPWLSIQLPGRYTEIPATSPNHMIAVTQKAVATEGDFQVELQLMEMAPGFRVIPENAIKSQKDNLLANPKVTAENVRPTQPVRYDAGRGQSFEFTTPTPRGTTLMRSVVLAFPGDAENPTQGLVLVMHGQGSEAYLRAQMDRIVDSIRYIH